VRAFVVVFAEHLPADKVASMAGQLTAWGEITAGPNSREFALVVRRDRRIHLLTDQLVGWERYGFARWRETPISN
jgi:hypothetical protein